MEVSLILKDELNQAGHLQNSVSIKDRTSPQIHVEYSGTIVFQCNQYVFLSATLCVVLPICVASSHTEPISRGNPKVCDMQRIGVNHLCH